MGLLLKKHQAIRAVVKQPPRKKNTDTPLNILNVSRLGV